MSDFDKKYKICTGSDVAALELEVSDFIENGFIPVGGISIHPELGMVAQAVYQRQTRTYVLKPVDAQ